jgi:hypothetical protein
MLFHIYIVYILKAYVFCLFLLRESTQFSQVCRTLAFEVGLNPDLLSLPSSCDTGISGHEGRKCINTAVEVLRPELTRYVFCSLSNTEIQFKIPPVSKLHVMKA